MPTKTIGEQTRETIAALEQKRQEAIRKIGELPSPSAAQIQKYELEAQDYARRAEELRRTLVQGNPIFQK